MNGKGELPPTLIFLLVMRGMVATDPGQELPSSESFSCDEDYHWERRNRSTSHKGLGNDAMSTVLNQISRLPFTRRIE